MSQQDHWYSQGAPPLDQPIPEPPRTNVLGIVGLVMGVVSLCACSGMLSPVALVVSLFALFRPQRGWAIAGVIVSALGCCCFLPIGLPVLLVATGVVSLSAMTIWIGTTLGLSPQQKTVLHSFVIGALLSAHYGATQTLPASLDELDLDPVILRDGWGHPFEYELDDKGGFILRTIGSDGVAGTGDDFELQGVARGGRIEIVAPATPRAPAGGSGTGSTGGPGGNGHGSTAPSDQSEPDAAPAETEPGGSGAGAR